MGEAGGGGARESKPAALVHDYSKNIICIREWNPNMLKSHMVTNQKSPPCRWQLKLKTYGWCPADLHLIWYEDDLLSWIIFINILLYTKKAPNWPTWMPFITALCLWRVGGSVAYWWHEMTRLQPAVLTVPYLGVRGGFECWAGGWAPHRSRISHPGNRMLSPVRKRRGDAG